MKYQIVIDFAEGVTPDAVALAKAVANNAILDKLGAPYGLVGARVRAPKLCEPHEIDVIDGGKFAEIYVAEISEITE